MVLKRNINVVVIKVKENNQLLGYIDGEVDFISNGAGSDISFNTPFLIGKDYRSGTGIPLHGSVDNLSIWDVAKSQEEIQGNMFSELSGYEQNLVGYWNFNDGEGTALTDLSGNGNDGEVNEAALTTDRHGKTKSAYKFAKGTGFIEANMASQLEGNSPFSISLWVKFNALEQDS